MISTQVVVQLAVANLFALAVLIASLFNPKLCRAMLVFLFAWASITNATISIRNPQAYVEYADFAQLQIYRDFILGPFASHVVWLVLPIALGQMAIAILLTRRDVWFTLGMVGITIFLTAITPLGVGAGGSFPIVVIVASWVLWKRRNELEAERSTHRTNA